MYLDEIIQRMTKDTSAEMNKILISYGKGNSRIIKKVGLKVTSNSNNIVIESQLNAYAKWLHLGRGKNKKQPPLRNIIAWCKRKSIPVKYAFPIARNIGIRGLPATHFLDPLYNMNKKIRKIVSEYYGDDLDDIIMKFFSVRLGKFITMDKK